MQHENASAHATSLVRCTGASWTTVSVGTAGVARVRSSAPTPRGACCGRRTGTIRRTRATPASVVMEKRGQPSPGALDHGGRRRPRVCGRGTESMHDSVALPAGAHRVACVPAPLLPKGQSRGPIGLRGRRGAAPRRDCHSTVVLQLLLSVTEMGSGLVADRVDADRGDPWRCSGHGPGRRRRRRRGGTSTGSTV
jgi:hypothetical protein